jgi:hypothetical protein
MKKAAKTPENAPVTLNSARPTAVAGLLTRAQVAERIGTSIATVRRLEGKGLTPHVDDEGTHRFHPKEVAALAASRANEATGREKIRNPIPVPEARTRGELAALVYERFEQRQSHAEIVIGLRVEPETVRELFDQWCLGLVEGQLRKRAPNVPLEEDIERANSVGLANRLAALPDGALTRISVGRWRGRYQAGDDQADYAWVVELGGFLVSGPCELVEITRRFGRGSFRVTAYGFDPSGLRWEVLVEELPRS